MCRRACWIQNFLSDGVVLVTSVSRCRAPDALMAKCGLLACRTCLVMLVTEACVWWCILWTVLVLGGLECRLVAIWFVLSGNDTVMLGLLLELTVNLSELLLTLTIRTCLVD